MKKSLNKNLLTIFFFISILVSFQDTSFASYDVVSAKTIENKNDFPSKLNEEIEQDNVIEDLPDFNPQDDLVSKIEKKFKKIFKRKADSKEVQEFDEEENTESIEKSEISSDQEPQFRSVEEKNEVSEKNKFQINADKVTYDDEQGSILADGNVEIIAKSQGVVLKAENAILDKNEQTLRLNGGVKVVKDGTEMTGEFLLVDLNEQNILVDNPQMEVYSFSIVAQEGYLIANDIQMLNGTIKSAKNTDFPLVTRGFMRYDDIGYGLGFDKKEKSADYLKNKRQNYKIDAKEIIVTSYKDHNSVTMKDSDVYYNNFKIARGADIEIISDKQSRITEINAPEAGNLRNFGTYLGYGFVHRMPKGHVFKFLPVVAFKGGDIGVGAIGRYRSQNHMVEGGWNTASENTVVRGRYNFSNKLAFTYGRNAYMSEGFLGGRRPGYAGQLQYTRSRKINDLDVIFSEGVYAGIFSDYQKYNQSDAYSTTRFRYMADIRKKMFKYSNPEQEFLLQVDSFVQGAATVYGSGETAGVVRIGPYLTTRYKKWDSNIGYALSGIHGESPFDFDQYRYGRSSIMINEKFNFNDKFALGFRLFMTPDKDNYKNEFFTEQRIYVVFGPDDAKIAFSYDFVRDVSHLDLMFLIGSDNAKINFEKLSTKDIDGKAQKIDFYKNVKPVIIEKPEDI